MTAAAIAHGPNSSARGMEHAATPRLDVRSARGAAAWARAASTSSGHASAMSHTTPGVPGWKA